MLCGLWLGCESLVCFEQGKNSTHVPSRERKMVKKSGAERTVIAKSC